MRVSSEEKRAYERAADADDRTLSAWVRVVLNRELPASDPSGGLYTKLNAIGVSNLAFGASRPDKAAGVISGTIASLATSGSGASQMSTTPQRLHPRHEHMLSVLDQLNTPQPLLE